MKGMETPKTIGIPPLWLEVLCLKQYLVNIQQRLSNASDLRFVGDIESKDRLSKEWPV
jgi:hypothetical protein